MQILTNQQIISLAKMRTEFGVFFSISKQIQITDI